MIDGYKGKHVLISGCGGFVGHHLARYLRARGKYVRGVDLNPPMFSSPAEMNEFHIMDLRDPKACELAVKDMDQVYNLAALNGSIEFTTNNKAELVHNNAMINLNMAEACWKAKVKKCFYSSSACVYPIHYQNTEFIHLLKEKDVDPAHPDTEYGWEKLFSEHVWMDYAEDRGMEVRIARFINVYGTECFIDTLKSKAPMALTRKVIEAGNGGNVEIWGDGKQRRTFCYISDLLDGIDRLMKSDVREPVNLGSDDLMSIDELVDLAADIEGVKVKKVHQRDKVQGVRVRCPDLTKANKLGWKRIVTMREGMTEINKFAHSIYI